MYNSAYILAKYSPSENNLLNLLRNQKVGFYLNSSLNIHNLGRYSFFGWEPFLTLQFKHGFITEEELGRRRHFKSDVFERIRFFLDKYRLNVKGKKMDFPFLGGAVGVLSYDLGFCLEKIPRKNPDELNIPDLWLAFFDVILGIDHQKNKILIFSSGFPETNSNLRRKRARKRLNCFLDKIKHFENRKNTRLIYNKTKQRYGLYSNFSYKDYLRAVNKTLDYILKGDIYQLNLSQRFYTKTDFSCEQLYANLKKVFPVPFGGLLKTDDFSIISGSPERFIQFDGEFVVTRPMKGTRPRAQDKSKDRQLKKSLGKSKKDMAELLMIVDLERNDLGRVCNYGSVQVESLRNFEEYSTVFQTTSQIKGRLYPQRDRIDIIKACFPGGSITGCPKIRAMEIIEELEPHRRGIYTGSMGYFSFNGTMDFNILIRSFFKRDKDVYFGVGGGIVYDSRPQAEYKETLVKAQALRQALNISESRRF